MPGRLDRKDGLKWVTLYMYRFSKYYEKDALAADPDYGTILSSLLGNVFRSGCFSS